MDRFLVSLRKSVKKGNFKLASGRESDFYINVKEVYCSPENARIIGKKLALAVKKMGRKVDRIAGIELGAIPLVTLASVYSGKPFLMVRKKAKGHGTGKLIEGNYRRNERVIIIEDVVTTGGSVIKTKKILEKSGLKVAGVITVLDREEGGRKNVERYTKFVSLYSKSDLLR